MLHAMLHVHVCVYMTHCTDVHGYFIFIFSSRNDIESLKTELDKLRLSVSAASPSGATSGRGRGGKGEGEGEGEGRGRGREGGSNERSGIMKASFSPGVPSSPVRQLLSENELLVNNA